MPSPVNASRAERERQLEALEPGWYRTSTGQLYEKREDGRLYAGSRGFDVSRIAANKNIGPVVAEVKDCRQLLIEPLEEEQPPAAPTEKQEGESAGEGESQGEDDGKTPCPHCDKSFKNVGRHIASKHPEEAGAQS